MELSIGLTSAQEEKREMNVYNIMRDTGGEDYPTEVAHIKK